MKFFSRMFLVSFSVSPHLWLLQGLLDFCENDSYMPTDEISQKDSKSECVSNLKAGPEMVFDFFSYGTSSKLRLKFSPFLRPSSEWIHKVEDIGTGDKNLLYFSPGWTIAEASLNLFSLCIQFSFLSPCLMQHVFNTDLNCALWPLFNLLASLSFCTVNTVKEGSITSVSIKSHFFFRTSKSSHKGFRYGDILVQWISVFLFPKNGLDYDTFMEII